MCQPQQRHRDQPRDNDGTTGCLLILSSLPLTTVNENPSGKDLPLLNGLRPLTISLLRAPAKAYVVLPAEMSRVLISLQDIMAAWIAKLQTLGKHTHYHELHEQLRTIKGSKAGRQTALVLAKEHLQGLHPQVP